jgi:hypothetical protein
MLNLLKKKNHSHHVFQYFLDGKPSKISSQGLSKEMANGLVIKQTVGQQSLTGNYSGDFIVLQGFQQSVWSKYIASNKTEDLVGIDIYTYPNPFTETIHFQFSEPITMLYQWF